MASVGGLSVDAMRLVGDASAAPGMEVATVTRPGTDLAAYRQQGRRPVLATYETDKFVSGGSGVKSAKAAYAGLMGGLVTLVDDHGQSYQVVVREVRVTREVAVVAVVGASGDRLVTARWAVEVVG
jgi:hypothetical protein